MVVQCPVCSKLLRVRDNEPSRKGKCPCGAIIILASSVAPHRRKQRIPTLHKKPVSHSDTTQIALSVVMPPPAPVGQDVDITWSPKTPTTRGTPTTVRTPSVIVSVPTDSQIPDEPTDRSENTASQVLLLILLLLLLAGVIWLYWL